MTLPNQSQSNQPARGFPDETHQKILQAAARVFAEQGYAGATTRVIAARAGVNEVTLFRHFENKRKLFQATIKDNSSLPGLELFMKQPLSGDYRQDLITMSTFILEMMQKRRKEILMILVEAERLPDMQEAMTFVPMQIRYMISSYLEQQVLSGQIRQIDTELAAQSLLGMLFSLGISRSILPEGLTQMAPEEMVTWMVELFIEGIRK